MVPEKKHMGRDAAAKYIISGMVASGDWPKGQKANVHFDTKVITSDPTDLRRVEISVTVKPIYSQEDVMDE